MKKLKAIINEIKTATTHTPEQLNHLLWQYICYSPKMALRLHQEELLREAEKFSLTVNDNFFAHKQLTFNGFKWGSGKRKILITHGWGSKAADFNDLIIALKAIGDTEIIAFDAPGNGSSESELSSLLLFIEAVKAIIPAYGKPDIIIGHSLGAMANIMALCQLQIIPPLLVSITPLVQLQENFEASLTAVEVPNAAQQDFLSSFEALFKQPASAFNLPAQYCFTGPVKHWLAYDAVDAVSPYAYLKAFLDSHPQISTHNYEGARHDKIIKHPQLIADIVDLAKMI